jgi:hypothetical protein
MQSHPQSSSHTAVIYWFCEKVFSVDGIVFYAACCAVKEVVCAMHVYRLRYFTGY